MKHLPSPKARRELISPAPLCETRSVCVQKGELLQPELPSSQESLGAALSPAAPLGSLRWSPGAGTGLLRISVTFSSQE